MLKSKIQNSLGTRAPLPIRYSQITTSPVIFNHIPYVSWRNPLFLWKSEAQLGLKAGYTHIILSIKSDANPQFMKQDSKENTKMYLIKWKRQSDAPK